MVLRVRHSPSRFPANIRYTPLDNTLLHSIPSGTGLLLFMHSDKSAWLLQVTSDKAPLSARNSSEVERIILTLETAFLAAVCLVAHPGRLDVARTAPQCLPPCRHYLLDPCNGNKEGSKGFVVRCVRPTPNLILTSSLRTLEF